MSILLLLACIVAIQCVDNSDSLNGGKDSLSRHRRQADIYYSYATILIYVGVCIGGCCLLCCPIIVIGVIVCIAVSLASKRSNQPSHVVTTTTTVPQPQTQPQPATYPPAGYAYPQPVHTQGYPPTTDMPKPPIGNYPDQTDMSPPHYEAVPGQQQPHIGFKT